MLISYDGDSELSDNLGTVDEIRYYRDLGYRFGVNHNDLGILAEGMLAPRPTGHHRQLLASTPA